MQQIRLCQVISADPTGPFLKLSTVTPTVCPDLLLLSVFLSFLGVEIKLDKKTPPPTGAVTAGSRERKFRQPSCQKPNHRWRVK